MAENTVASWGGLEIQLVSEDVVNVINTVKGALELVNEFLSIGLQIAEVAKTFVTSNLDLARAAIKELIALLRGLIQDLLNVGLFANFADLETLKRNKAGLKGGYDGWERRMITRLNDRNDPNRPNFSESTTVIAMFVYVGVPDYKLFVGQYFNKKYFDPIIQSINAFKALFGYATGGSNDGLPIAVNLHTEYASPTGTTSQDVSLVASSFAGNSRVKVVWNSAPAPGGSDQDPNPQPPSSGYIVEVSCYPHGFQAGWIAPSTAGTGSSVPGAGTSDQAYTTGQYMTATTGRTLTIFGGEDSINLLPEVAWPDGYVPGHGTLPAGHTPLYFYTDPSAPDPIIKAFGKSADGTYYNQRSFYVPQLSVFTQMLSGANYTFELKKEELPKFCPIENGRIDTGHAEGPQTVYVRVIPVTSRITEENFNQARWTPRPRHDDSASLVSIVCPSGNAEPPSVTMTLAPQAKCWRWQFPTRTRTSTPRQSRQPSQFSSCRGATSCLPTRWPRTHRPPRMRLFTPRGWRSLPQRCFGGWTFRTPRTTFHGGGCRPSLLSKISTHESSSKPTVTSAHRAPSHPPY